VTSSANVKTHIEFMFLEICHNWLRDPLIDLKPFQKGTQSLDLHSCKVSSRLDPGKGPKSQFTVLETI